MGWNENIAATVTHVRGDRPTLDLVPDHHIAQINIGVMIAPTDDPSVAGFMENLDHINAQADAAEGFVWRLQSEQGNATDIQIFPNPLELVNMSVWESVDTLKSYVYRTEHVEFFRRRAAWFEADGKRVALWSVRPGRIPTLADAVRRVEFMEHHGPTPYAFGFAQPPPALVFETVGGTEATPVERSAEHPASSGQDWILQARYDGRVVGTGALRQIGSTTGEIVRVDVDDSVNGLSIDVALADQLELMAEGMGLNELTTGRSRQP